MVVVWLRRYYSISPRASTTTSTPLMTSRQAQADQRKALLLLPRFLFRFEEYSCSRPASRLCPDSAPPRKATGTVFFRPASETVIAQLLIDAVRRLVAKSATLMKRIRKLQSQPTTTKVSDDGWCDYARFDWTDGQCELAKGWRNA
jgi:hypothetical protein